METIAPAPLATALADELAREAAATRRLLERIPEAHLAWRPHPRSMSLGELGLHVAGLAGGIADFITPLAAEVPAVPLPEARSVQEILDALEASTARASGAIGRWGEEGLEEDFRMVAGRETLMAMPRREWIRTLMLNHAYHHRGQLTVYLRLLDVPLPPIYGPTADEA
jgi:uncharacterized damage-inducible protein DinB